MHQHVTHNRHYPTQKQFANAILRFFRETIPNEWETFQSQVSDNFRVITYEKFRVLQYVRYSRQNSRCTAAGRLRRAHLSSTFAESNTETVAMGGTAQDKRVAILDKAAGLASF